MKFCVLILSVFQLACLSFVQCEHHGVSTVVKTFVGATVQLRCDIGTTSLNGSKVKWMKDNDVIDSKTDTRYSFVQPKKDHPNTYLLIINDIKLTDNSTYACSTPHNETTRQFILFVTEPRTHDKSEKMVTEVEVKAGKKALFKCDVNLMNATYVEMKWYKDDQPIDETTNERYSFSANHVFTIEDVKYTDRASYRCYVAVDHNIYSEKFILRVRDPLGALWPFIGIVIEALILAIIIGSYERIHSKKKDDGSDGESIVEDEKPLINNSSYASFNANKGEVNTNSA